MDHVALGGVLSREQLRALIGSPDRPLITGMLDGETQIQPNGVDLTLREVSRHSGQGTIGVDNAERVLPDLEPLPFDEDGWLTLSPGVYHILYNEVVNIPETLMALGRPRSSLNRCGVTIHTAVWDAGYTGRSTSMLVVNNPDGFRVQRDARVMQLVFFGMSEATAEGYRGRYQGENLGKSDARSSDIGAARKQWPLRSDAGDRNLRWPMIAGGRLVASLDRAEVDERVGSLCLFLEICRAAQLATEAHVDVVIRAIRDFRLSGIASEDGIQQ